MDRCKECGALLTVYNTSCKGFVDNGIEEFPVCDSCWSDMRRYDYLDDEEREYRARYGFYC